MKRVALLAGAAVLMAGFAGTPAAFAQSDAAALSIINQLRPTAGGGTRGLRMPDAGGSPAPVAAPAPVWNHAPTAAPPAAAPRPTREAAQRPISTPPARETTATAPSVSITVVFPSGSATLTPEAERALAPLGRALASPELAPYRFRIEGHTDTVGDPALNQALSERRAQAVRDYLASSFGVNPSRLVSVGFGASQLLVPTPAQVPEPRNRRVQVVNLGA